METQWTCSAKVEHRDFGWRV